MKKRLLSLLATAVVIGAAATIQAQTFPAPPAWDGTFSLPDVSGKFNPLRLTTESVSWNGKGSVQIPFSINQRAMVWLAVYKTGSSETGARGPNNAWLRLEPQDLFVYVSAGQNFEAGDNTLTWNGQDWRGTAAGEGSYSFDVIAINTLDKPVLAGPSARTGFGHNLIDTRQNPPEVWIQEGDRQLDDIGLKAGDMIRGTLGTDYLANPNAWERWNYDGVLDFEGARTLGGMRFDDKDPNIFWTTHHSGDTGGLYKMRINRAAKIWEKETSFGNNGFAKNNTDRVMAIEPWGDIVYAAHWGKEAVPFCAIEVWDKTTGEIIKAYDVTEFFTRTKLDDNGNEVTTGQGPGQIGVNQNGIWMCSHGWPNIAFIKHDGTLMWVNRNGDVLGDQVSEEDAAALGLTAAAGTNIQIQPNASGHVAFFTTNGNNRGTSFSALGRDGAALFEITFPSTLGPFQPTGAWFLRVVDENGKYDGLYWGSGASLVTHLFEQAAGEKYGPGMLLYIPFGVASAALGSSATVVEEVERVSVPTRYVLKDAYPNPFNPETTVEFSVPGGARDQVRVRVYNTAGQQVATLVDEPLAGGVYRTTWNGRDQQGASLSSGVYYFRLQAGAFAATRAVTLLK